MYKLEERLRNDRYKHDTKNPSFSSSLLDEIYRSIDDGDRKSQDRKFYKETLQRKQNNKSNNNVKTNRTKVEEEEVSSFVRASLMEKWMEKKANQKINLQKKKSSAEMERKLRHDHDHDQDVMFFSSSSSSSDSSSGGFSSSDTESMHGSRPKSSCLVPYLPKPVKTSLAVRPEKSKKTEKTERSLFYEQRELHMVDDYHHNSATGHTPKHVESLVIKSKLRAWKIYNNLKKVKQPISPGGRLSSFINSLFTTGTPKKTKSSSSVMSCDDLTTERKLNSSQESTCSSASSFSRSCLSKHSPSTRERLRNGVKRSVRFCPVSVIVDEDCRPCGHKSLYEQEDKASLMSVSVPKVWKIGKSPTRKSDDELKVHVMEKSRRVEEMAREFLRDYHNQNPKKKSELMLRDVRLKYDIVEDEDDDDDDAASYSSSDLFELDHLAVMASDRYREELPVYETTHVDTNRAIANGLIM